MNALFIYGSQKNMPPQGISNALSLNVSSPTTQVWVVVVHSWDWGRQQSPWPSGPPGPQGRGPGQTVPFLGPAMQSCIILL